MGYIMKDDFNDNSINTEKWNETDPNSRVAEANNRLELANPHSAARDYFEDYLLSDLSLSLGIITAQCNLTWTTDGSSEAGGGIHLYKDDNNYAAIRSRSGGGDYGLRIYSGGEFVYSVDSEITKGKDIKIEYDVSATTIKFFYWNVNTWTQMGTTQTYDLGTPLFLGFTSGDGIAYNGADPVIIDNAYLVKGSYATQYPLIEPSGGIPMLFGGGVAIG